MAKTTETSYREERFRAIATASMTILFALALWAIWCSGGWPLVPFLAFFVALGGYVAYLHIRAGWFSNAE